MKKAIPLALLIISLILIYTYPANALVFVEDYYRSDGTYVKSHFRTSPNAFKFDNFSWTPSQGYFNESYYSTDKDYGTEWYTPYRDYYYDGDYLSDYYYYKNKSYLPNDYPDYNSKPYIYSEPDDYNYYPPNEYDYSPYEYNSSPYSNDYYNEPSPYNYWYEEDNSSSDSYNYNYYGGYDY